MSNRLVGLAIVAVGVATLALALFALVQDEVRPITWAQLVGGVALLVAGGVLARRR